MLRYLRKDYIPWQFWPITLFSVIVGLSSGILFKAADVGALVFTAVFIAWYSIETRNLVMEMKITNVLAVQPVVVLDYVREGGWVIYLRNIGKGAAIKLELHPQDQNYKLEMDKHTLAAGEEILVRIYKKRQNDQDDWGIVEDYHKEFQSNPLQIKIIFHNTLKVNPLYASAVVHNPSKIETML